MKRSMEQDLKSQKVKSQSELLNEFQELPKQQKLNKLASMYFKKCWKSALIVNGKFNFSAYNYIKKTINENIESQEQYLFYKYLLSIEPTPLTIFDCLKLAKEYVKNENKKIEQAKIKSLEIGEQVDYGDLLKCL